MCRLLQTPAGTEMMRIGRLASIIFLLLRLVIYTTSSHAQVVEYRREEIESGPELIVVQQSWAPTFALHVTYRVGSAQDPAGKAGLAHLVEHLMFRGSSRVAPGEHAYLVQRLGGVVNGGTAADRTVYYSTYPANQLELAIFLEADRMHGLELSADSLERERQIVINERRLRVDGRAYGATRPAILRALYAGSGYETPVVGTIADLSRITLEDVTTFYHRYYCPQNALISLVGDVQWNNAVALVRKHFEGLRGCASEELEDDRPAGAGRKEQVVIHDQFARMPRVDIVYQVPRVGTEAWFGILLAGQLLAGDGTSFLHDSLIASNEILHSVRWSVRHSLGIPIGVLSAYLPHDTTTGEAVAALDREIARFIDSGPSPENLDHVLSRFDRQSAFALLSNLETAKLLSQYWLFYDDISLLNRFDDILRAFDASEIKSIAKDVFNENGRIIILTLPQQHNSDEEQ